MRPEKLAAILGISVEDLARVTGLPSKAVGGESRWGARNVQVRLREVVRILDQVLGRCGSLSRAYAWYRSEPVPSLGYMTAEALVKVGKGNLVSQYLDRIADGGYT